MEEYRCKYCRGLFNLDKQKVNHVIRDKGYIACPYCGSKAIGLFKFEGIEGCMKGGEIDSWKIT
ncbi:hypothetical protein [Proteiniclasticum sp. QWL-01]|uniref:hypothetical protein n=1 Tax=Proteiniclasticum sp. QWL-01 TaxID=3036945 RepID=UPI00240FB585|nr:hypothetical protein [Proteiniclasticum sp. QWL-01]WFF72693.1 hypothetical protein P6M73_15695 [Proteiniclasticum sp. QWL-01]